MKPYLKILSAFAFVLCYHVTEAQLSAGIEAGVTTSSVKISGIKNEFTDAIKGNGIMGFQAGPFLKAGIGPVYLKPALLLDYQGGMVSFVEQGENHDVRFRAGRILLPVLAGFKILPPALSIEAGPVYNHMVFATRDFNGNQLDLKQDGLGYRVGVNAQLSILNLSMHYQGIKNSGSVSSLSTYQTPDQLIFTVGIEF